jgi:nucleotide-binding universal stress UspA family protein
MSTGTLVVGVDGSPGARAALDYAVREALDREMAVLVVAAYEPALTGVTATGAVPSARDVADRVQEVARTEVDAVVAGLPTDRTPGLDVGIEVVSGPAPTVLTRLSRDADALIVGHRGRGGLASRLIGSVSLSCVVHAETTVVVVRRPRAEGGT